MLGTTVPTPLYPDYQARLGFGPLTVTIVFATYAVGVLVALLAFGRASDTIGRRPTLLGGLGAAALSGLVFLLAAPVTDHGLGLTLLIIGRFLSGISAGIFTGSATATLADYAGSEHKTRASLVAAVANIGGLGLGPLVAGALAKQVPHPLVVPYAVHLGLVAVAAALLAVVPETVRIDGPRRLTVQRLEVPDQLRAIFIQAGTAGFAGFAVLGFFTAVTPATLAVLGHHDPLVTGAVVFVVFAASALGQVASLPMPVRSALLTGTAVLIVGVGGVGAGIGLKALWLLVAGGAVAGLGQGLSFRSALGSVTGASPSDRRASVSSSFFALCYVGISLPVVGIGAASAAYGLVRTAEVFAGIVAVLALAAFTSLARRREYATVGS
jgi:predicted MFS family arabinose efflux permease